MNFGNESLAIIPNVCFFTCWKSGMISASASRMGAIERSVGDGAGGSTSFRFCKSKVSFEGSFFPVEGSGVSFVGTLSSDTVVFAGRGVYASVCVMMQLISCFSRELRFSSKGAPSARYDV
ncbi:hypothetical protein OGAPHI_004408 [Ogataea philodendri]|uniref:Uncharacterized protein n=1 Tax=Ogataea philodendri TaxID=1378263 RepID=A0A9P8P761_9ASCO|nr:uncharacterized protein OGAPHI_004408 [Ogataea philodendri]KAH3666219.1 hypothetical protein OGAPHI_004408 [Ogataea philodendri]